MSEKRWIIPPDRTRYLAEIAETCEAYDAFVAAQAAIARRMYQLHGTIEALRANVGKKRLEIVEPTDRATTSCRSPSASRASRRSRRAGRALSRSRGAARRRSAASCSPSGRRRSAATPRRSISSRCATRSSSSTSTTESLSHLRIPKVALPRVRGLGRSC